MKKAFIAIVLLSSSCFLIGCGKTTGTTDGSTTTSGSNQSMFSVASCNSYVELMKCIIDKSPETSKVQSQKSFDEVTMLWKSLTPDQLSKACDANMKAIEQQKTVIESMGCTVK